MAIAIAIPITLTRRVPEPSGIRVVRRLRDRRTLVNSRSS
jgi:hypothetical protein